MEIKMTDADHSDHAPGPTSPVTARLQQWPWFVAGLLLAIAAAVRIVAEQRYGLPIGLTLLAVVIMANHLVDRHRARRAVPPPDAASAGR
ncbi:hypothetical protein [Amycolatopsis sp. lyj-23]|uniref:hypothetical protein n=1 Tax=Amycolatopsis sp. lyj-23 TaxID=2789283 RepID=UPI00397D844E